MASFCPEYLEVAEKMRKDQGRHECEVFECEPDSRRCYQAWDGCEKGRGHADYIPVREFSEDKLPAKYRSEALARLIKEMAELTVRLRMSHVSACRPDGYMFAGIRGKNARYTGTGWVYDVNDGEGPCPCRRCREGRPSEDPWWNIVVFTACHVVYDRKEAENAEVDFFYDDEESQKKTLPGCGVEDNNARDDVCLLQCATHDVALVTTLKASISRYEVLQRRVGRPEAATFCIVISHPHGLPKRVAVGDLRGTANFDPDESFLSDYMFTYTAATCRGSSGAPVVSAISEQAIGARGVWPGAGPHSMGGVDDQRTLNQCGPGAFYVDASEYLVCIGRPPSTFIGVLMVFWRE